MKTEIIIVTDRSGSMQSIRQATIDGYNKFIAEQKIVPGEARVTSIQFDDRYEKAFEGLDIARVPNLNAETFVPRGYTALLDAMGRTLNEQGERIAREKWADLVIVYVTTDGGENASQEYNQDKIRVMSRHAEEAGWKFIYQGANQDSFSVAANLGLKHAFVSNYAATVGGTQSAYATASVQTRSLRSQV